MRLAQCHSSQDFRELVRRRLPGPIFNYIDRAAGDETAYRRNTAALEELDLLAHVLRGTEEIDLSTTVMDLPLDVPCFLMPTAPQRPFHHRGERTAAAAAAKMARCSEYRRWAP